jgi:hypothetical protein
VLSYVQEDAMSASESADVEHSPMRLPSTHVTRVQRH